MFGTGSGTPQFNFGAATGATTTTQTTTGNMGIFGATTQTKPSTGFNFGATPTQTTTSAATKAFNFGNTGTTAIAAATPLQGTNVTTSSTPGFAFAQPIVSGTTAVKAIQPTSTAGGFNLGNIGGAKTLTTTSSAPSGGLSFNLTTTPGTTGSTGLLGATAPTTTTTTKATTATGLAGFAMPVTSSTAAPVTTATTGLVPTTTAASTGLPQTQITYQQLEENINKWMADLEKQETDFLQQATQVNAWDRLLVENGEKITALNSDMERVKIDQQKLDHELDFIKSQQRELEELLVPLEKSVEQQPNISFQQHADLERENTYQLAENVDAQLKRMVQDLKDIIDHLNTNSNQDNADPIQQITKILNAHMDALQWVDQNTALLGRRVEDVAKQMEVQRKEQERNFRLVYN